ncbi:glycosyl hydrolase family 16 [Hydrogenoanaerobacterium saccharovorans]|uniref:Glycosyl hydrolases family 16 n=1 Tax=Hydrogenoanaerobacterium saccharovorans TaxID=474960 RepID=A0A1H8B045_9FIRM|nr:glycoside hydrolase family 16 protein [Hydrogenoanaerobacterium saccharovorans]RPF47693.1 glycosyl hydrolase family 16 [Hydrogenoanaerobacterium saccharovorans]SEM75418.1 Glycosyl hydrolases family 16 [Hydrogenoanaerobacterium saccharovorans]
MKTSIFWKKLLTSTLCISIIASIGSGTTVYAADYPANPPDKAEWQLDFADEFDGPELDKTKFTDNYLTHWTTLEQSKANYTFENGNLVLKIDKDQGGWRPGTVQMISSIATGMRDGLHRFGNDVEMVDHHRANTNYETKYGYFELRARIQGGPGMHCAWWMVGNQDNANEVTEIDIFEILGKECGANRSKVNVSVHPWADPASREQSLNYYANADLSNEFHVYGFEWDETGMKFYFDNQLVKQTSQTPNYKMTTLLGIYEAPNSWTGIPDPNALYPKKFEIDYFRAYKRPAMIEQERTPAAGENLAPYAVKGSDKSWDWNNPPSNAGDNNAYTCMQSKDNVTFPQYIYFDWKDGQDFDTVALKSWYAQGQAPTNWDVEVSADGETNWSTVASSGDMTWNTNTVDIESKVLAFSKVTGQKAMRLKINSANTAWKHFAINEVIVKDSSTPCVGTNIANEAIPIMNSADAGFLTDNNLGKATQSKDNLAMPQYITLSWATPVSFDRVKMHCWYAQSQAPTNVDIETSADGTAWMTAANSGDLVWHSNDKTIESKDFTFTSVENVKHLRIKINSANLDWKHFAINELEVFDGASSILP